MALPSEDPAELREPSRQAGLVSLWRQRDVLRLMVRASRKSRYRDSTLGVVWAFIPPLVRFAVYYAVIGGILGLRDNIPNFPVYIFTGLVVTGLFNGALGATTRSVLANRKKLQAVSMSAELFPLTAVATQVSQLVPQLLILLAAALATGWGPDPLGLLHGLAGLALVLAFSLGIGLFTSAANAFRRDVGLAVGSLGFVVFWASPVIYPVSLVREVVGDGFLYQLYLANPVTLGVFGVREAFYAPTVDEVPTVPDLGLPIVIGLTVTLVLLVAGQLFFDRFERRFADVL